MLDRGGKSIKKLTKASYVESRKEKIADKRGCWTIRRSFTFSRLQITYEAGDLVRGLFDEGIPFSGD